MFAFVGLTELHQQECPSQKSVLKDRSRKQSPLLWDLQVHPGPSQVLQRLLLSHCLEPYLPRPTYRIAQRGGEVYMPRSRLRKVKVEHHLILSHTHLRAQLEPFSAQSRPSMSSLPKTWSISVRLASLLLRPQVSSAAHNARMYGIVMRCVLLSSYVVVICVLNSKAHYCRLAKTTIGRFTRKSVLRCRGGRRALHRPMLLFPQSR